MTVVGGYGESQCQMFNILLNLFPLGIVIVIEIHGNCWEGWQASKHVIIVADGKHMGIISSIFHYDVVETSTPPYLFIHLLAFNGFFGFFEMIDKFGFDGCFFGGCFTFQNGQIGSLAHLHFTLVCFHTIISHLCFIIIKLS